MTMAPMPVNPEDYASPLPGTPGTLTAESLPGLPPEFQILSVHGLNVHTPQRRTRRCAIPEHRRQIRHLQRALEAARGAEAHSKASRPRRVVWFTLGWAWAIGASLVINYFF